MAKIKPDQLHKDCPSAIIKIMKPYLAKKGTSQLTIFFFDFNSFCQTAPEKKDVPCRDPELNPKGSSVIGKSFIARRYAKKLLEIKSINNQATTMKVYQSKQNKKVCILSTLHTSVMFNTTTKKKPETVKL